MSLPHDAHCTYATTCLLYDVYDDTRCLHKTVRTHKFYTPVRMLYTQPVLI